MESIPTGQVSTRAGARNKSATIAKVDGAKVDAAKDKAKPRGKAKVEQGTTSDPTDIDRTIATTAYFLAAARNFEPGHELEDWLEAERRVRAAVR